MKMPAGLVWLIVIVALVCGGVLWWQLLPTHRKEFYKNFARQIKYLPDRYMA